MDNIEIFNVLKAEVQEIIDAIAAKEFKTANNKLVLVSDKVDDLLDTTEDDELMVEISKYQVLLNHLHLKINSAE